MYASPDGRVAHLYVSPEMASVHGFDDIERPEEYDEVMLASEDSTFSFLHAFAVGNYGMHDDAPILLN